MVWTALQEQAHNCVRWALSVSPAPKREKGSTIHYGYRTWGTHARVFSQTLTHRYSKNKIRQ